MNKNALPRESFLLLVIQALSGFIQWIDIFLIFIIPSYFWKSSPDQIAVVAALFGLPSLFLGPLFGAYLDRSDPRRLMIAGLVLRSVFTLLIAFSPTFLLFSTLVLAKGLANLIYWPSSSIMTNAVVLKESRVKYFSILSALEQGGKIGAPVICGLLITVMPPQRIFLISTVVSLICLTILLRLNRNFAFQARIIDVSRSSYIQGVLQGFKSFQTLHPMLLLSMAMSIGMSWVLAIYDSHVAAYLAAMNFETFSFSLVLFSTAVGAMAAAACTGFVIRSISPLNLMRIGAAIFSAAVLLTAGLVSLTPDKLDQIKLCALWFFNGFGYELFQIGASVNFQNRCPSSLLGRVSTALRSMQLTAIVTGPTLGAWLITHHNRSAPFIAAAVGAALLLSVAIALGRGKA